MQGPRPGFRQGEAVYDINRGSARQGRQGTRRGSIHDIMVVFEHRNIKGEGGAVTRTTKNTGKGEASGDMAQ